MQPKPYTTKKNEVGFTGVFASTYNTPCVNCLEQRGGSFIYKDAIPITPSLSSYLRSNTAKSPKKEIRTLESFRPEHIMLFLKRHMR